MNNKRQKKYSYHIWQKKQNNQEKQTKESEIKNNTTNTSQNRTEDYEKNRGYDYDYDNPEAMYETYSHPDAYEGEMGVYMVNKNEADFD